MLRAILILLCCLALCPAYSQSIRYESSSGGGIERKAYRVAAEKQGRADWPVKSLAQSKPGTQIQVTFDYRNADITFFAGKDYPNPRLLKTLQQIFPVLGYTNADYIVTEHEFAPDVDVELNDYLVHPESNVTTFSFDLARLAQALEKTDLPRPIVFGIKPRHSRLNTVTLGGAPIDEITFLSTTEVKPNQTLFWRAAVHWSGWLALIFLGALLLFGIVTPWLVFFGKKSPEIAPDAIPDPAEVQKAYDKARPVWLTMLPAVLLPIALFATGGATRALESAQFLVPQPSGTGMIALPLAMLVSIILASLVRRLRDMRDPISATTVADPDTPPAWVRNVFVLGLAFPMGMMALLLLFLSLGINPLRSLPFSWRTSATNWLPIALPVVGFLPLGVLSLLAARKTRTTLRPGDPWFDRTQEIARCAGVRVRNVVVIQSVTRNAYASLFGTVGLTSKLLREFSTEEVTAIVAHEIGHHRDGHVKRTFWVSFAVTIALLGAWWALAMFWEKRLPPHDERRALLSSPLFATIILPLLRNVLIGRGQREREFAADRFAVETTNDPALVIRTLEKLHTRNGTPHRLKPSDQALTSHPDLDKRIERIRSEWDHFATASGPAL